MKIQIDDYDLSLSEYRESFRIHNASMWRNVSSTVIFLTVLTLIILYDAIGKESQWGIMLAVGLGVMAVSAAYLRFVLLPYTSPKMVYRANQEYKDQLILIDENGIHSKSSVGEGFLKWEAVVDMKRSEQGIVLCLPAKAWLYLPYRYLTLAERQELRDRFLQTRTSSPA